MRVDEVMELNAKSRDKKKKLELHHIEIHPERDMQGKIVKGGGHVVHSVYSEPGDDYGRKRLEKPFGAGEHEEMLAHVASELKLPEPELEEEEQEGEKGKKGREEDEGGAAGAAY